MERRLVSTGAPSPETVDELGSRYLSANGSIGLRGTLDEFGAAQKTAITINGLYDKVGELWREPVNAPNGCLFALSCGGEELGALGTRALSHEQSLDFASGIQGRSTSFLTGKGERIRLSSSRFVSLASPRLICAEYVIEVDSGLELAVRSGISAEIWDLSGPHLSGFEAGEEGGCLLLSCRSSERGVAVRVAELTEAGADFSPSGRTESGAQGIFRLFGFRAEPGRRYLFRKYVEVADDSVDGGLRCAEAAGACARAAREGWEAWLARQTGAWAERWAGCDIEIDGDEAAELAVRYSMYQLLSIAPPAGSGLSIPARGLSGQMYRGAVFWDTEIFMLPFFINSFPGIARTLVEYRIATLPGARRKATEYGHRGAFFAWESQEGGEEACTLFNVNDVIKRRPIRTFFRDRQMHISADVAFALWRYFLATGDRGLLLEGGAELMYECARFIVSWLYYKPGTDSYELLDVTGPDEYHERVHNDCYTNAVCAYALRACLAMDSLLAGEEPEARSRIVSVLEMEAELAALPGIAARLKVPRPEPATGVIPQFDGYFELEDIALSELLAKRLHPNEYLGGGDGLARWTQVIKQADVVLALALDLVDDREGRGDALARANLDYYEPRTEHGSSLSASAYSLLAGRLGRAEEAYAFFMKTATADLSGEARQYVGDLYIGGTHPAANGGAWLSLFAGILGIRAEGDSLSIAPSLPSGWTSVRLTIGCGGTAQRCAVRATISNRRVELKALGLPVPGPIPGPAAGRFPRSLKVAALGAELVWDGSSKVVLEAQDKETTTCSST